MDYKKIGFKAGLEIHQQLDTHKLFCNCPSEMPEHVDYSFERVLRPTQSEMGDVDRAALAEARRKRRFLYTASNESTCLVESDEEPPHSANEEAVDICLTMAMLLGAKPVDEINFMRKIVIDGSNTTGFQRTALIAINGKLGDVGIDTIALEEDAARKISEKGKLVNYGLDRLGIPLIEIATNADIKSPEHAREIAEQIGALLHATKKVKKELGTIRQDLNVSISRGARVEIKGIQSLSSISKVAEREALRQMGILEIRDILNQRAHKNDLDTIEKIDLTSVFKHCTSKIINKHLKNNGCIKGICLIGFHGLLGREHTRLGRELAAYASISSGIEGIMHSDELPGYGITEKEVRRVEKVLKVENEDCFVLALGKESIVDNALNAVIKRAKMFFDGVQESVRKSLPDNTTDYMRPLPGAARMYPETDVPHIRITTDRLKKIKIPERPEEKHKRFISQYSLNEEQVKQILCSGYGDNFERLVTKFPNLKNVIIRTFLNTFSELEKEGITTDNIDNKTLIDVFSALCKGKYAKEAVYDILKYLAQHSNDSLEKAIEACGVGSADKEDIVKIVKRIVSERKQFIEERGAKALGPLMGIVMKELRGKADGAVISKILEKEMQRVIS
ncbi:MAG: Glu-tRNA(Gln) amidotransferase subunit GatE [Petrotogales bacterium]